MRFAYVVRSRRALNRGTLLTNLCPGDLGNLTNGRAGCTLYTNITDDVVMSTLVRMCEFLLKVVRTAREKEGHRRRSPSVVPQIIREYSTLSVTPGNKNENCCS